MNPEEMVTALLTADQASREELLHPQNADYYLQVVSLLKDEVDRKRISDPQAALQITEIAVQVADYAGVPACQALACWAKGNVLVHLGDYTGSLGLFDQAAEIYASEGAEMEVARLNGNKAFVLQGLGRSEQALEAIESAVAIARKEQAYQFLGAMLMVMGSVYRQLTRYDDALQVYQESERLYAEQENEIEVARVRINKANVLENLDRFSEAIELLHNAHQTLEAHEHSLEVARADLNLGITYTRLGHYDAAITHFNQAERAFNALENQLEVAVVELYLADLYAEFNLIEELLHMTTRDWEIFDERELQWQAARASLHQASAWRRLKEWKQTSDALELAKQGFRQSGDPVWQALCDLEEAKLYVEAGDPMRALPLAEETAATLSAKDLPLRAADASLLAGWSYLETSRLDQAARCFHETMEIAVQFNTPALQYRAQHGLGRVAQSQDRLAESQSYYHEAINIIEQQRQRLRVEDFRAGFMEDKLNLFRDAVLLCLETGQEEEAFAYVERAKSGSLVDLLIASLGERPDIQEAVGEQLLAKLEDIREQLNWHYNKIEGDEAGERGPLTAARQAESWQRISALEIEANRTWRQIQQLRPFYKTLDQPDRSTPAVVSTYLQPGETFLQFYSGGEKLFVFIVTQDGLRYYHELVCTQTRVREGVRSIDTILKSTASFEAEYIHDTLEPLTQQALSWLYDDLVRPLEPYLEGVQRLIISPDRVLFEVPFHALFDGQGYLLESYEVSYTPSAGTLRLCQENYRRGGHEPGAALVMGVTVGGSLPHILQEVQSVANVIPSATVFTKDKATADRFLDHAGRSQLLHLATHAVFRQDNPLFSSLRFAGESWLRAMDLYGLDLKGALVTLSACETGRQRMLGGDLFGLSRAFFCGGVSTLVASLWPVSDISTAHLMKGFYTRMTRGETAAAALRKAQLDLCRMQTRENGHSVRPYAHPFYWAPFYLSGASEFRLQERRL